MAYNPGISYRGDAHLAQGMASLGDSIGRGVAAKGQMSQARKRYGKIFDALGMDQDEVANMSLPEMEGTLEGMVMQYAQRRQEEDMQTRQLQNQTMGQKVQQMTAAREGEQRLMNQLGQYSQGVGQGVLSPEVMERYGLAMQNPATAAAADMQIPLEVAQRYFGIDSAMTPLDAARTRKTAAEAERLERELAGAPGTFESAEAAEAALGDRRGQAIQGSDGRFRIQFQLGAQEKKLRETQLLEAMREAGAVGDTAAEEVYSDILDRLRDTGQLDPMAQRVLAMTNPTLLGELLANQRSTERKEPDKTPALVAPIDFYEDLP